MIFLKRSFVIVCVSLQLISSAGTLWQEPKPQQPRTRANSNRKRASSPANSNEEQPSPAEQISPRLDSLLSQARSAPAEFRSDALIRIAGSALVKTRKLKQDLLAEAFDAAGGPQFPVKRTLFSSGNTDTRVGNLEGAYGLNLDSV